ncbi:uncharacterized protein N7506_007672 [Penicillium brevicompactum]|uniref:uncharacterized protein n=1 Tax=Penicillium brevicompactum TaxID=5074 RepID=UPI0025405917|nr:uncharacterized protein N7506_007672 [Penicillium brevicompactum]KAJ5333889.1 hypothetical protein N7506_007672 [Penicillium brevicompactum]
MAIAVANCSQTPLASLDKGGHPPKQSMWQRLGWRKLLGRDDRDTSGDSQDETSPSDHSRAKHDNLTRRISRKVGVGLPKNPKRQSADFERLAPREPDHRRALSADRRPMSAQRTRTRSPPPTDPRQSAPEIQWLGPPTTTVDDIEPEPEDDGIDDMSEHWDPYPDPDPEFDMDMDMDVSKVPEPEVEDIIDLEMELEQRWILNLSMHFRDRSEREKFFVTYAETPNRWRRVTVSCDYRDAPPDSLEGELKGLRYQRDKCARIYESIRESLLGIRFYDGVTNLKLETSDGQLHVFVTEDVNETIPYPPISSIGHLVGAPMVPEHMLHFESHLSGFVYKVNFGGRYYIKKEIPGPDTVDEFLYEINALHALNGIPSVIQTEGIVIDEEKCVVKGLLISYAEQGALIDILYENRGRTEFKRRERWAKQIVQGLCEIHESGYVQGDFTLANIVVDAADNAKIIDINRRGCPVGWEPPEIAAKIESNQRISMYIGVKTDLFQLGMTLWALAMEDDEPERQPRPLFLSEDAKVPDYYRRIVQICLSPNPRHRLSAKELLALFPPDMRTVRMPAVRPLHIVPNDPEYFPTRHDYGWSQPAPAELKMADPRDLARHPDQYYPPHEFSDNVYRDLQQPIFDKHDLEKRSAITLADANGATAFSSKPSSSSTLNHHESNNDEYNHSRYTDEQSHYEPWGNQSSEAVPVSHDTPGSNMATTMNQPVYAKPPTNTQPPSSRMSTGSTTESHRDLPVSEITTSPLKVPLSIPQPQDELQSTTKEDLLSSSCLTINPALSSSQISEGHQNAPTTTIPPSTPTKRNDLDQPKTTNTVAPFTGQSPAMSLLTSASSISPKAGITGASLGLGTKFPAASPFTNMLRQSGGQPPFKSADVKPSMNSHTTASPVQPFVSSVSALDSTKACLAGPTSTTSAELSPAERPKTGAPIQPRTNAIDIKPTSYTEPDSSSLHGSSLPISPASVNSEEAKAVTQVARRQSKSRDSKPTWTTPSNLTTSLLHSGLPVSPVSANHYSEDKAAKPSHAKPASGHPMLLRSPDSTSSLIDSRLPISPATVNSKSIAEAVNQPYTSSVSAKSAFTKSSDSVRSLVDSQLPKSPEPTNLASVPETLAQPPSKPVNIAPLSANSSEPSSEPFPLLSSSLPISPASLDAAPPVTSVSPKQVRGPSNLLDSSLPISPASVNSSTPAPAMNHPPSKFEILKPTPARASDSSSLLGSSLPISPASVNSRPAMIPNDAFAKSTAKSGLARSSDQITLLGSSLPISPAFTGPEASPAAPVAHRQSLSQMRPTRHQTPTHSSRATSSK